MATTATRSTQSALGNERVIRGLRAQLNNRSILSQYILRNERSWAQGREISKVLKVGNSGGTGWSDTGILPVAGHTEITRAKWNYKRNYGSFEIDGFWIEDTSQPAAAVAQPLNLEMTSMIQSLKWNFNIALYGGGDGVLATPTSASAAATLIVDSIRNLRRGMIIDIIKSGDGTVGGGVLQATIDNVVVSSKTVTLKDNTLGDWNEIASSPSNYRLYFQGSRNQVIFGLDAIVSTSNPSLGQYGQIDRDTSDYWKAQVLTTTNPQMISLELLQELRDLIDLHSDGGDPDLIITSHKQWNRIAKLLDSRREYRGQMMKLNGWLKAIEWIDVPIVADRHCPEDTLYMLSTGGFRLYQNNEGGWLDKDGTILKAIPGRDRYRGSWGKHCQLICEAPNQQGAITNLDTTGIAT